MNLHIFSVVLIVGTVISQSRTENDHNGIIDNTIRKRIKRVGTMALIGRVIKTCKLVTEIAGWKVYQKSGGYRQAVLDFNSFNLRKVVKFADWRTGSRGQVVVHLKKRNGTPQITVSKKIKQPKGSKKPDIYRVTKFIEYSE